MKKDEYDLNDLYKSWDNLTNKVNELNNSINDLEEVLLNFDSDYKNRDEEILDTILAFGRQTEELNYCMKNKLKELEKRYNVNYNKNRRVNTSKQTAILNFKEFLKYIVDSSKKYKEINNYD